VGFLRDLSGAPPKETHISAVFVGKDTVWKLKKAVRLPFLDFTSLSARRHFLQRELALNRPAAPEIYRDVAAVVRRSDGSLAVSADEGETPIDWVLRMTPVPEQDFLDAMAARGVLGPEIQDALGDCIAQYHAGLRPVFGWDSLGALLRTAEGSARSAVEVGLARDAVLHWLDGVREELHERAPWLAGRADAGSVRRCHGDLHLGNLCLWRGKPVPFDALEFDEELATTDVGYDLAFLLMDLDQRVGRAAANRVMNRTIARNDEAAGHPWTSRISLNARHDPCSRAGSCRSYRGGQRLLVRGTGVSITATRHCARHRRFAGHGQIDAGQNFGTRIGCCAGCARIAQRRNPQTPV
jgi:aminoglycoside phosphotransferase family enzyme